MDLLGNLALGFGVAFTVQNLVYAFFGCVLGTLIGVLPGIGPVATIAMLLPSIYTLDATPALIMLAGIYYGAQYGGSTTAILINVPGESSSVVTALDGYQMARQGRAGAALSVAALGSFFAGCVGTVVIAAFAPPLTELAFKFGPAEYSSLMVLGLIGAVALASGSLLKAIAMIVLGLLLAQINTDASSGTARYSFDVAQLGDGIGFIVIAIGVFGFGEVIAHLGRPAGDDVEPAAVLGPDRLDVDRQRAARPPQPAAGRRLDPAADGAVPAALSGAHALLLRRRLHAQPRELRRLPDGAVRLRRL